MRIFQTLLAIGDDGYVYRMDTIEYEGRVWLVPAWLESRATGGRKPERMICLDNLPHQRIDPQDSPVDSPIHFRLVDPIPKTVLEGRVPPGLESVYVVLEAPEIGPTPDESRH
jgi:hypothetical protein